MDRRDAMLSLLALGAATGPLLARAQPSGKVARVGYLGPSTETAPRLVKAFQEGLAALGYVEGRNLVVEYRWTNAGTSMTDEATLVANARDLVSRKVDVLVASIDPAILAAKKAAGTVPIVMLNATDPVELGLVATLAHPGGNVTGLTRLSVELIEKNLQVLLEAIPQARRVALLVAGAPSMNRLYGRQATQAARDRRVALQVVELRNVTELEDAFATIRRGKAEGLLVPDTGGGTFFTERARLTGLVLSHRLPAIYANAEIVESGGLMAYSPSAVVNYRRAATFIDKILRGVPPGDIPVEQPTAFELVVNLKTAKAMGLALPPSLLLRADRVIE